MSPHPKQAVASPAVRTSSKANRQTVGSVRLSDPDLPGIALTERIVMKKTVSKKVSKSTNPTPQAAPAAAAPAPAAKAPAKAEAPLRLPRKQRPRRPSAPNRRSAKRPLPSSWRQRALSSPRTTPQRLPRVHGRPRPKTTSSDGKCWKVASLLATRLTLSLVTATTSGLTWPFKT